MADYETRDNGRIVETRRSGGGGWLIAIIVIVALVVAAFAFGLVNIDQLSGGKVPTVNVEATGGEVPKFDVKTADIDVGQKEETVKVPTVDVGSTDTQVTLPTISVDPVGDANRKDK